MCLYNTTDGYIKFMIHAVRRRSQNFLAGRHFPPLFITLSCHNVRKASNHRCISTTSFTSTPVSFPYYRGAPTSFPYYRGGLTFSEFFDVRACRSIPANFPYFHVEFGTGGGFAHVIDDDSQFSKDFGLVRAI